MDGRDLIAATQEGDAAGYDTRDSGGSSLTLRVIQWLVLAACAAVIIQYVRPAPRLVAGSAYAAPVQVELLEAMELPAPEGYTITATDEYTLEGIIVSRKRYSSGRESELGPVDFAMAWGDLTREPNLNGIKYSQGNRWYYYRYKKDAVTVTAAEVIAQSANVHILPETGNDALRDRLMDFRRGDEVRITGYLVQVRGDDGWRWDSSRVRTDTGARSCEVIYVTSAERLGP